MKNNLRKNETKLESVGQSKKKYNLSRIEEINERKKEILVTIKGLIQQKLMEMLLPNQINICSSGTFISSPPPL